jgi:hypothetical protein
VRGPALVHALTPAAAWSIVVAPRSAENTMHARANFRTEYRSDDKRFLMIGRYRKTGQDFTVLGAILFCQREYGMYGEGLAAVSVVG